MAAASVGTWIDRMPSTSGEPRGTSATRCAEARRLGEATTGVDHVTDLAAETDLTEEHGVARQRRADERADHRQSHTEVGGRLGELDAADASTRTRPGRRREGRNDAR